MKKGKNKKQEEVSAVDAQDFINPDEKPLA